ncbi:hypothetical protein KUTeg_022110 [Tegillarca granosa]|nr:hypothetical protein KUTeg_022110 [Tegillarca granosa]
MNAIQGHEKRLDTQDQALKEQDLKIKELESAVNAQDMTISNQNHEIRSLQESIKHLQLNQEEQDQYSRRNCLVFKNVPLNTDINSIDTDKVVLDICSKLGVQVDLQDISRSHILGRPKTVKLRAEVYKNKKKLKNHQHKIFITEHLTKHRFQLVQRLNSLRLAMKIESYWTLDGRIFVKLFNKQRKIIIKNQNDIDALE